LFLVERGFPEHCDTALDVRVEPPLRLDARGAEVVEHLVEGSAIVFVISRRGGRDRGESQAAVDEVLDKLLKRLRLRRGRAATRQEHKQNDHEQNEQEQSGDRKAQWHWRRFGSEVRFEFEYTPVLRLLL